MQPTHFQIYTQFYIHHERICSELAHERWQRSVETLITVLHQSSSSALVSMEQLLEQSEDIWSSQGELLEHHTHLDKLIRASSNELEHIIQQNGVTISEALNASLSLSLRIRHDQEVHFAVQEKQFKLLRDDSSLIADSLETSTTLMQKQYSMMYEAQEVIDQVVQKWLPLWESIYAVSMDTNVSSK